MKSKYLIIVESPTKAKTISSFLDEEYIVEFTKGHIRDLPAYQLGIEIDNNFRPVYVFLLGAKKIIQRIKKIMEKDIQCVYLATDFDREGEAIAWHLRETLGLSKGKKHLKYSRITFHEVTQNAIQEALKNGRDLNMNLVNAQQSRRLLDRLVGYKISPLLWKKVRRGLSAGRVQSVALRLIVEREKEIKEFVPQPYWSIEAQLKKKQNNQIFSATLIKKGEHKYERLEINTEQQADKIVKELKNGKYQVEKIEINQKKRNPFPPFITSTLQQESSQKLGFSPAKTMLIAQQLYEGIELKKGAREGLITYMRTDSVKVANQAVKQARTFIRDYFGEKFVPSQVKLFKNKGKNIQEAHEAIRPTDVFNTPEKIEKMTNKDQFKLYQLIWKRFVASLMKEAIFENKSIDIKCKDYVLRATGQKCLFKGFLEVYGIEEDELTKELPELKEKENLILVDVGSEQHFTQPPPRFNEATLIKTLEENGIGRPSTYAPIISTIQKRGYVRLENKKLYAQEIGIIVNDILVKNFPSIVDIEFTANMEKQLDLIALGKKDWVEVVREFYQNLEKLLKESEKNIQKIKPEDEPTEKICEKCGAPLVIRQGRYGKFYACSNFPRCRWTMPFVEPTDLKCEKCGAPLIKRMGKNGPFLACSKYPQCKYTRSLS